MAELDYAFLAEYAKISDGLLTAVGGSFTHLVVDELPAPFNLFAAGRVRASKGGEARLTVVIRGPEGVYELRLDAVMTDDGTARPYGADERVGLLFVATGLVPLIGAGTYAVELLLDDAHVRTLRFDVAEGSRP